MDTIPQLPLGDFTRSQLSMHCVHLYLCKNILIIFILYIWGSTKWQTSCRPNFQIYFFQWNVYVIDPNFIGVCDWSVPLIIGLSYHCLRLWFLDFPCIKPWTWKHFYTPAQWSCWGVYWFHSVSPSVRPSVCPASHVRSVAPTVLVGSILYLYTLSSNCRRCVTYKVFLQNLKI